jgi:hypothetical protein
MLKDTPRSIQKILVTLPLFEVHCPIWLGSCIKNVLTFDSIHSTYLSVPSLTEGKYYLDFSTQVVYLIVAHMETTK